MEKIIKKFLYTGVGIVASATERLQTVVDNLVEHGKMSEEEGKKVVDDVVDNTERKKDEYENRFRKLIDSAMSKIQLPKADAYEKLEKRIRSLEVKVGLLTKEVEAQKGKKNDTARKSK